MLPCPFPTTITITPRAPLYLYYYCCYWYHYSYTTQSCLAGFLRGFHFRFIYLYIYLPWRNSKSPQISCSVISILTNFNSCVVWKVPKLLLVSSSSRHCSWPKYSSYNYNIYQLHISLISPSFFTLFMSILRSVNLSSFLAFNYFYSADSWNNKIQ